MRAFINIMEQWDSSHKAMGGFNAINDVDLWLNPDRKEFSKLFHDCKHGLRALILDNGDLIVWDAYLSYHSDIQNILMDQGRSPQDAWLLLYPDHLALNDAQMDVNDHEEPDIAHFPFGRYLTRKIAATRSNTALRRFYGPDMKLLAVDNDTGEEHLVTDEWVADNCCPVTD